MWCEYCQENTLIRKSKVDGVDRCVKCKQPFESKELKRLRSKEKLKELREQMKVKTNYELFPKRR
jgi:hypothetical protein